MTAELRFPESLSVETSEIRTNMRTRPKSQTNTPTWELKDMLAISPNSTRNPFERLIVFREIEISDKASTVIIVRNPKSQLERLVIQENRSRTNNRNSSRAQGIMTI